MSESLKQQVARIVGEMGKLRESVWTWPDWYLEFARRLRAEWDKEQELSASHYVCPHCNAEQQKQSGNVGHFYGVKLDPLSLEPVEQQKREPVNESDIVHAADTLIEDLAHVKAGSSLERGIILGAFSIFAKLYAAPPAQDALEDSTPATYEEFMNAEFGPESVAKAQDDYAKEITK